MYDFYAERAPKVTFLKQLKNQKTDRKIKKCRKRQKPVDICSFFKKQKCGRSTRTRKKCKSGPMTPFLTFQQVSRSELPDSGLTTEITRNAANLLKRTLKIQFADSFLICCFRNFTLRRESTTEIGKFRGFVTNQKQCKITKMRFGLVQQF